MLKPTSPPDSPILAVDDMGLGGGISDAPVLQFIEEWEVYATVSETDPKSAEKALESPHASDWRKVIDEEIEADRVRLE